MTMFSINHKKAVYFDRIQTVAKNEVIMKQAHGCGIFIF